MSVVNDPTALELVLIFIGIPAVVVLILVLAILAPGWTRAGRYRPGESWNYEPVLINGAMSGDVKRELTATAVGELGNVAGSASGGQEGGASARW